MLGAKIGMKRVPVRALKLPTMSICIVFQGEAIGDGGKSPKPYFWGQNGPKKNPCLGSHAGVISFRMFLHMAPQRNDLTLDGMGSAAPQTFRGVRGRVDQ